jgi:hypothetical protein
MRGKRTWLLLNDNNNQLKIKPIKHHCNPHKTLSLSTELTLKLSYYNQSQNREWKNEYGKVMGFVISGK